MDYPAMYKTLFQSQTKAIELQEQAVKILKKAQIETEEMYISAPDTEVRFFPLQPVGQDTRDKEEAAEDVPPSRDLK